jgi:hypothetical protein
LNQPLPIKPSPQPDFRFRNGAVPALFVLCPMQSMLQGRPIRQFGLL